MEKLKEEKISVVLARKVDLRDVTFDFFENDDAFTSLYAVAELENGRYCFVERSDPNIMFVFKEITCLRKGIYLLVYENGKKSIMVFDSDNDELLFSIKFDELVKSKNDFYLVRIDNKYVFIVADSTAIFDSAMNYKIIKDKTDEYTIISRGETITYFKDFEEINDETLLLKSTYNKLLKFNFSSNDLKLSVSKIFHDIIQIFDYCILVKVKDNQEALISLMYDENDFCVVFSKVIKVFKKYLLVECLDRSIKLISLDSYKYLEWNKINNGVNNVILDLPNGKKTILTEKLDYIDLEFDSVDEKYYSKKADNKFRIINFNDDKKESAIIRIVDLQVSERFKIVERLNSSCVDYLKVICKHTNKSALIRVDDFYISEFYDEVDLLNSELAEVIKDGKKYVMRIRDFAIAKWPEDSED